MALREILATLGVEVDSKDLDTFDKRISGALDSIKGFGAAIAGAAVVGGIKHLLDEQIELGSRINDTALRLGVGTDELQKFEYAGKLAGISADTMGTALGFLNKNIGNAAEGNAAAQKAFAGLGIALKDSQGPRETSDVFLDVVDALDSMDSQAQRTAVAMQLFGRGGAALLPALAEGREGFEKLFKEADDLGIILGKDFVEAADEAGDQLDRLGFVTRALKSQAALALLPIVKDIAMKLTEWAAKARKLASETNVVQAGLAALGVVGAFQIGKLINVFGVLAKSPIILFATGLFLLFEDLYTLMTGGESVIGETLDKLFGAGAASEFAKQLWDVWDQLVIAFQAASPALAQIGEIGKAALGPILNIFVWLVKILASALTLLGGLVTAIGEMANAFGDVRKKGGSVFDAIFSRAGAAGSLLAPEGKAGKAIDRAGDAVFGSGSKPGLLSVPAPRPGGPQWSGMVPGNVTQTNQVEINVNGAGDPKAVAREVQSFQRDNTDLRSAMEAGSIRQ